VRGLSLAAIEEYLFAMTNAIRWIRNTVFAHATLLLCVICAFAAAPLGAGEAGPLVWTTSMQTGLAETFQLTLGGTFGQGPDWQNKLTTGLSNVFHNGDSLYGFGWDTFDTLGHSNNWQAGLGYKVLILKKRNHALTIGSGVQRWLLPSVKTGTNDWLIPGSLVYQTSIHRLPLTVTSDSWTLLKSTLPTGSEVYTQAWLTHRLLKREHMSVAFRHGPAYTYAWNFWGANGERVFRYQTMLAITWRNTLLEGGWRKQWGLQPGIHNNGYWQFAVTRTHSQDVPR
jgi:hypothetical protein